MTNSNAKLRHLVLGLLAFAVALSATNAFAQTGRIDGRVIDAEQEGIEGVIVVLNETGALEVTDSDGRFRFDGLAAGTVSLSFTLGAESSAEQVQVVSGQTATVLKQVDWEVALLETITVFGASRRRERVVDAPAAVTVVTEEKIEQEAAHGQVPKLLEFTPGAEVTQSGLYDYNFNTRGFNSSLNRRVATLVDGRDPSVPFLGAQEWAAISFPLDELASAEFVRGPSAALYGSNASSGVLNLVSKQPKYSQGGLLRVTGGQIDTFNADFRWAESLGNEWYLRLMGGVRNTGDFTRSRNPPSVPRPEYSTYCSFPGQTDCLPAEAVPLSRLENNDITMGGIRADKYFGSKLLTFETGTTNLKGPVFQSGIGRIQLLNVDRPWARVNFNTEHWNFLGYYTKREGNPQRSLSSGQNLVLDTDRIQFEAQGNWNFGASDRHRIVVGGAVGAEDINSADPQTGRQTLMFAPFDNEKQALFGQVDLGLSDKLKLVVAARWDEADVHDSQLSPKASLVYSIGGDQSLRFTYNEAFQVPNYSELFLAAPVAAPADLTGGTGVDPCAAQTSGAIDCGLGGPVPVLAVGNSSLDVEETQTFEIGYTGILGGRTLITADYYNSDNENFITDLIPQIGTPLSVDVDNDGTPDRLNPNFGPWQAPAGTPGPLEAGVRAAINASLNAIGAELSNAPDGSPIVVARSYSTFGQVDTQGIDFGLNHFFTEDWSAMLNYSWFDFEIQGQTPGLNQLLLPNSPEHKVSAGVSFSGESFDASLSARWVDTFRWVVGPFQGDVQSYTTVDFSGSYEIDDNWSFGFNVANLLDDEHHESFGGDILERRALGNIQFSWK